MKKIESARIVEKQEGNCLGISCYTCFNEKWCDDKGCYAPSFYCPDKLKLAKAYIKRHEGKSKKRIIPTKYTADVQPDKTGAVLNKIVTLPKEKPEIKSTIQCYKCISVQTCKRKEKELSILPACDGYISNESMNYIHTVDPNEKKVESVLTTTPSNGITTIDMSNPTPLDIAKAIRDNWYRCHDLKINGTGFRCKHCPFNPGSCGSGLDDEPQSERDRRKQLIDDYIARHETVKTDSIINSEPKPISLPDVVYSASKFGVSFVNTKDKTFTTNEKGELFINNEPCFTIPEEALSVALKRWQK